MSRGGEITTPVEWGVARYGRGRDRPAGGDSRPASSLGPGARAARSDREGHRFSSRARACGWSRRESRRCPDSSLSRSGHRARAGRATGDHVERRVISPDRAPASGPLNRAKAGVRPPRGSQTPGRAAGRRKGLARQGFRGCAGGTGCPADSISHSGPSSARAGPSDRLSACRFRSARSGGSGAMGITLGRLAGVHRAWPIGVTGLGHYEIAPPSAARNHPVRRR